MTVDTALGLLGLIASVGGLIAARLDMRQLVRLALVALVVFTAFFVVLQFKRVGELASVEEQVRLKLASNRWTQDRISEELDREDKRSIREALALAVDAGRIIGERTECVSSKDGLLISRVYFNANR